MQTKRESLVESSVNIALGFITGILSQLLVFPLMGITVSMSENLILAVYFTVISLVRNYLVRRYYNNKLRK